ncbi:MULTISPECIES: hypothetical protein [unclassified Rathayibacter]|uniref:hypothetical protein n=1 Tax=unclassified Rathayibacter TaxID=2609250 RepID=UPI001050C2EA|nr:MULTISPECIES: hypothetical protein [unclassified Rathayibacter]TCL77879.1 hypothetical protein EDF49_11422 [Rathayibacter sp. PhB192]TCM23778.1 hypothetical protein EDF43_11465 [Rathayibacter sp. PhB179]
MTSSQLATAIAAADHAAAARLHEHVNALWAAKNDPDATRALLRCFADELENVRSRLHDALEPIWWNRVGLDQALRTYADAQVWARSNADCDELSRLFVRTMTAHGDW